MNEVNKFIAYLRALETHKETNNHNRAILADMRRGLADLPDLSPHLHRYIVSHLPTHASRWQKQSFYLIASLFAMHPKSAGTSETTRYLNMGDHFALTLSKQKGENSGNDAIERRFNVLLTAHPADLHFYLRQAIAFLKTKEDGIAINWQQLLYDVLDWQNENKRNRIQERWAMRFWG